MPDAKGNIKGASFSGKAGQTLEKALKSDIFEEEMRAAADEWLEENPQWWDAGPDWDLR